LNFTDKISGFEKRIIDFEVEITTNKIKSKGKENMGPLDRDRLQIVSENDDTLDYYLKV
jgi:hypothetical protein